MVNIIKHALKTVGYGIIGGLIVLIVIFVLFLNGRTDLNIWHKAELDAEFTKGTSIQNFEGYLALEKRLFTQLEERVLNRIPARAQSRINRFHMGSLADPNRWKPNWNRTFELKTDSPKAGILLLHGMSDSPYSLRHIGHRLHSAGAWVIGLRLPGHGTAPSGLTRIKWEDMAAAVNLAMNSLSIKVNKRPLYIVGYSNGATLAVNYALSRIEDDSRPEVKGIFLISPSMGVTPMAAFAKWQARLGRLLGLKKLEWNSILPEYDPFKYNSFAVNAGDQVHRFTNEIKSKIETMGKAGMLDRFPPVLAFQSVVDATVSMTAVIDNLFRKLPSGGHELMLFDINRVSDIEHVLKNDPKPAIDVIFDEPELSFTIGLITNVSETSRYVNILQRKPDTGTSRIPLNLKWPANLFSLSHVALPFPLNDPLYGLVPSKEAQLRLGNIASRGERGVLRISGTDMLRLRCNPFYPYLEKRLLEFVGLGDP